MSRGVRRVGARSKAAPAGAKARGEASANRTELRSGANCSGTCATRDHATYGECLRAKGIQLSPHVNGEYGSRQKQWDKDLDHYDSARRQGVEPEGTQRWQVDKAMKEADK